MLLFSIVIAPSTIRAWIVDAWGFTLRIVKRVTASWGGNGAELCSSFLQKSQINYSFFSSQKLHVCLTKSEKWGRFTPSFAHFQLARFIENGNSDPLHCTRRVWVRKANSQMKFRVLVSVLAFLGLSSTEVQAQTLAAAAQQPVAQRGGTTTFPAPPPQTPPQAPDQPGTCRGLPAGVDYRCVAEQVRPFIGPANAAATVVVARRTTAPTSCRPGMASLNCCAVRFLAFLPGENGAPGRCLRYSALANLTVGVSRAARDDAHAAQAEAHTATTTVRAVVAELPNVGNEAVCRFYMTNRTRVPGLLPPDGVDCAHAAAVFDRLQVAIPAPVTPPADPPPAPSPAPAAPPPPAPAP